jgi:Domain of unknown function (DUF4136)
VHKPLLSAVALAATLAVGGCATSIPPVEVTRFHRIDTAAAIPAGTYDVVARAGEPTTLADRSYGAAVAQQLDRLGYRSTMTMAAGQPDYIVTVGVDRAERPADDNGSGVSVGVGGGTGGYRSGLGVGVGLDLTRLLGGRRDVIATRMTVRIARRGEELALWEGRAETTAKSGTPAAQPGLAAEKLAAALFADFPGRSGETISVP